MVNTHIYKADEKRWRSTKTNFCQLDIMIVRCSYDLYNLCLRGCMSGKLILANVVATQKCPYWKLHVILEANSLFSRTICEFRLHITEFSQWQNNSSGISLPSPKWYPKRIFGVLLFLIAIDGITPCVEPMITIIPGELAVSYEKSSIPSLRRLTNVVTF